jgi:ATP phosphoribosyltransferase
MRAAGLHAISTLLQSEAVLISSSHPKNPDMVKLVKNRIAGVIASAKYVICQYNIRRELLAQAEVRGFLSSGTIC